MKLRSIFLTLFMFFSGISLVGCGWLKDDGTADPADPADLTCEKYPASEPAKDFSCTKTEVGQRGETVITTSSRLVVYADSDDEACPKANFFEYQPDATTSCSTEKECTDAKDAWIKAQTDAGATCS